MNYKHHFMNGDNNAGNPIVLKERMPLQHPFYLRSSVIPKIVSRQKRRKVNNLILTTKLVFTKNTKGIERQA